MWKLLALVCVLGACGAQLDDGVGASNNGGTDGGGSGSGSGSGSGMQPDAAVTCANGRVVYLNFDGVTLTQGSPSDATQNRVSWMTNASAVVPRYHDGSGTRATDIQTIVNGVKSRLSTTPIGVVTTRPPSGPYVMIVFGGANTNNNGTVGTPYSAATNEHDCGDTVKNDIGWVSDAPSVSYAQDLAVGAVGWGLGLQGTNDPADCMCAWANNCSSASGACTLSANIATTTSSSPATTCPNMNPQNEVAAFSTGFCQ